jgi:hypothetical protein
VEIYGGGGANTAFARTDSGDIYAWGNATCGAVANGHTAGRVELPTKVPELNNIVSLSFDYNAGIASDSKGRVYTWGTDWITRGRLGQGSGPFDIEACVYRREPDGYTESAPANTRPHRVPGIDQIVQVGMGYSATALRADGTVYTWGPQPATGSAIITVTSPQPIPTISDVQKISTPNNTTFALKRDGTVWAWGSNSCGEIGDGTDREVIGPIQVPGVRDAVDIASDPFGTTMALLRDGSTLVWGGFCAGEKKNMRTPRASDEIPITVLRPVLDTGPRKVVRIYRSGNYGFITVVDVDNVAYSYNASWDSAYWERLP